MKINTVNEFRVEVELTLAEMERLGVSFESLDWADLETRRALWSVLGALREQGVEIGLGGRLLIEAGRAPQGMRLCFTVLPQKKGVPRAPRVVKDEALAVLCCKTARDARAAASCLGQTAFTACRRGDTYYLLVPDGYGAAGLSRAAEFCVSLRRCAPLAQPFFEEFCEPFPAR